MVIILPTTEVLIPIYVYHLADGTALKVSSTLLCSDESTHHAGSAASAVFATFELLEGIPSKLQPADIMRCQRVASDWKACVRRSAPLQRVNAHKEPAQAAWLLDPNAYSPFRVDLRGTDVVD